jgi:hypothetical protein
MLHRTLSLPGLTVVGALTATVLVVNARDQLFDTNFVFLSEAVSLLAGDHPYRDFFESGTPAAKYLSAASQWVVGYRLIGEFALQWLFITAGVLLSVHLGLQASRSRLASVAGLALTLVLLSYTPTYHYTKLFVFPLALWCGWAYLDRPGVRRSVLLGCVTAAGFLIRHDYVMYIAFLSVISILLACASMPVRAGLALAVRHASAYALAAAVVVAPWAIVVQMNEGLVEYTRSRTQMYESPRGLVYSALLNINPLRDLAAHPPPPTPGVVAFVWNPTRADETLQRDLEQRYRLTRLSERDEQGRLQYAAANVFDTRLLELDPYINDGKGFEWDRLQEIRWHLPQRDNALAWLMHVMLLIPLLLLIAGGVSHWRVRARAAPEGMDARRLILAGAFLVVIDSSLFRQPSYFVTVAPLTLALGGRFLARGHIVGRSAAIVVLLLSAYAAVVWTREAPMFRPSRLGSSMSETFTQLLASPPVLDTPWFRYLHDCTAPGDRLIVTGSTPFDVTYYAQRPMAGGHQLWHRGWRSDPAHEAESLALLSRQRVPFAFSTSDPVLDDFRQYPRIREYLVNNFSEVDGYDGRLLVNTTLQPVRGFGPMSLRCFQ